ncbi:hypothetical protein KY310_01165 [Candidatus Woesearchaeota archaeon]|nr:hypothetical protein [Candidatus Woesearchaeota archaeon]
MEKKYLFVIGVILVIIILFAYFMFKPAAEYYTDEPSDWVETVGVAEKEINVDKVSKGQAFDNERNLYFYINGTKTSFEYEGYYKGNYFSKEYAENGAVLMRVNPEMKPNDGIIEGVLVERFINNTYQVFIFVDEDWKNNIPYTNIVWGEDYVFEVPFEFKEISSGIYLTQIDDDPRRFGLNHRVSFSGIIVGDITQQQVKDGITEGITAIVFQ